MDDMQAVILSGGLGTRLRSVDPTVPKTMVNVNGHPFLFHLIKMLKNRGIARMVFLLAYKSEIVTRFLKSISKSEHLSIDWSIEPSPMGTAGALKYAESLCDQKFLLINGDSYLDMNYEQLFSFYVNSGFKAVVTVYDNKMATDVTNNVAVDGASRVISYDRKGSGLKYSYVDAGVVVMERALISLIPEDKVCSIEEYMYAPLIKMEALGYFAVTDRFYDIGTPDRLREFESVLRKMDHQ